MTIEHHIFQRLGAGPISIADLDDINSDDLAITLKFMVERRQICVQDGHVVLFWHRHTIPPSTMSSAASLRVVA